MLFGKKSFLPKAFNILCTSFLKKTMLKLKYGYSKKEEVTLTKFAFDANVIIGFDNIHRLKIVLKKLEELNDKVYIDKENYYEVLRGRKRI
jgi:hypothetical protein